MNHEETAPAHGNFFLMWYEGNPKVSSLARIEDAVNAYIRRYKQRPTLVLLSENELPTLTSAHERMQQHGIALRLSSIVRRNNVWVGQDNETHQDRPAPRPDTA